MVRAAHVGAIGSMSSSTRPLRLAFYLRSCRSLHYFANLEPYIAHYRSRAGVDARVVVGDLITGWAETPEFAGYRELFTRDRGLDRYDLVITPTVLRPDERPPGTRAVQVFHGMSDKPFTYARDLHDYELCLCVGQRQLERLLLNPANRRMRWALIGYPKFDRIEAVPRTGANERPRVIYCPTWRKGELSSLERFLPARPVVERIVDRFDLWVKPHPNLLDPARPYYDAQLVEELQELATIPGVELIEGGNVMPWFAAADLYLGDISASGYEWLYFNRPMVFLNPRPGELRPSDRFTSRTYLWQCGRVCDEPDELPRALTNALATDPHGEIRERVLHYSVFRPRDGQATARGISEIDAVLGVGGRGVV